ncbi:hypothetical protein ACN28S_07325 [Cystobacter fuscus]
MRSWDASLLEYAPSFWEDADREFAMAWLALRLSVPNAPRIRLPDGAVLLQEGPGVLAEMRITQRTEPQPGEPMQASLLYVRPKNSRSESVSPDFMVVVPTHAVEKG